MSAARKNRRNRRNHSGRCVGSATPQPAPLSANNQESGFKAVTQDYNRKAFAYLLGVAHDPGYKPVELRKIIMESLGVSKIHASYLIVAVRALSRIANLCKNITAAGTIDVARLVIIGKYLRGLNNKQLQQIQSELRKLCDSPEWITPTTMRKMLAQARITVDDKARRHAQEIARRREQAKANNAKPAIITSLPNGAMEVVLRLHQGPAQAFYQQLTVTAEKAHVSVEEYLCTYVTDLCAALASGAIPWEAESTGLTKPSKAAGRAISDNTDPNDPATGSPVKSAAASPPDTGAAVA